MSDPIVTDPSATPAAPAADPTAPAAPAADPTAPIAPTTTDPNAPAWNAYLSDVNKSNDRLQGIESLDALAEALISSPQAPVVPAPNEYGLGEGHERLTEAANKLSLTKAQLDGLMTHNDTELAFIDAEYKQGLETLKTGEWKDVFDANLNVAQKTLSHFDKDGEMTKILRESRAGNNPTVVKFLHAIGLTLGEDTFVSGDTTPPNSGKTQAQRLYPKQGTT